VSRGLTSHSTLYRSLYGRFLHNRDDLVGHCSRHPELPAGKVILLAPTHGYRRRGRQRGTFLDTPKKDAEDVYGRSRRLDDPY